MGVKTMIDFELLHSETIVSIKPSAVNGVMQVPKSCRFEVDGAIIYHGATKHVVKGSRVETLEKLRQADPDRNAMIKFFTWLVRLSFEEGFREGAITKPKGDKWEAFWTKSQAKDRLESTK